MRFILAAKSWHLFAILLVWQSITVIFEVYVFDNTHSQVKRIVIAILTLPIFSYPFLIGLAFLKILPDYDNQVEKRFSRFKILAFILMFLFAIDIFIDVRVNKMGLLTNILVSVPIFYCYFNFFSFPGWALKSLELKREAGLWEYIADSFQMWCWPLGMFWLQPRINDVLRKHEMKSGKIE